MGLSVDARVLAVVMVVFRLLRLMVATGFVMTMFGSDAVGRWLESKSIVGKATKVREQLEDQFSRDNMSLVGGIVLVSFCDCSFLQFLPWRPSLVFTESKGFPTISVLRWCLSAMVIQSTISVICHIIFLVLANRDEEEVPMTAQEKALFGLNITSAIIGAVMGIVMLCLKDGLISRLEDGHGKDGHKSDDEATEREGKSMHDYSIFPEVAERSIMTTNPMIGNALAQIHVPTFGLDATTEVTISHLHNIEEGAIKASAKERIKALQIKAGEVKCCTHG